MRVSSIPVFVALLVVAVCAVVLVTAYLGRRPLTASAVAAELECALSRGGVCTCIAPGYPGISVAPDAACGLEERLPERRPPWRLEEPR